MMTKRHRLLRAGLLVVVALLLLQPAQAAAEQRDADLLNILKVKHQELSDGFTMSVVLRVPANPFDPVHGWEYQTGTVTSDGAAIGIKSVSRYEIPPCFRPIGVADYSPVDYDQDGNLIVWRTLQKCSYFASDINDTREELQKLRVNPEGTIVDSVRHVELYRYPVGSWDNIYDYPHILMAVGRGLSSQIESIETMGTAKDGLLEVEARGKLGPKVTGLWSLAVDPSADYLIRYASFHSDKTPESPTILVTTSGTVVSDGLTLAERGEVKYLFGDEPSYDIAVEVREAAATPDAALLSEIRNQVTAPLPPSASEIADFRVTPHQRTSGGVEQEQ